MKIRWSATARSQADEAAALIARDGPGTAASWLVGLFDAVERLRDFPESGRQVPEVHRRDLREILYSGYRVIYRTDPERVSILLVWHGRRPVAPEIEARGESPEPPD